jgi:hypothetical protein
VVELVLLFYICELELEVIEGKVFVQTLLQIPEKQSLCEEQVFPLQYEP